MHTQSNLHCGCKNLLLNGLLSALSHAGGMLRYVLSMMDVIWITSSPPPSAQYNSANSPGHSWPSGPVKFLLSLSALFTTAADHSMEYTRRYLCVTKGPVHPEGAEPPKQVKTT